MPNTPTPSPPNRRGSFRQLPKRKLRVACRNALDLGPNLAVGLLDLSENGVRLQVNTELGKGKEVTVTLDSVRNIKTMKRVGAVIWCVATAEPGNFTVGVRFDKRIPYADVAGLTGL